MSTSSFDEKELLLQHRMFHQPLYDFFLPYQYIPIWGLSAAENVSPSKASSIPQRSTRALFRAWLPVVIVSIVATDMPMIQLAKASLTSVRCRPSLMSTTSSSGWSKSSFPSGSGWSWFVSTPFAIWDESSSVLHPQPTLFWLSLLPTLWMLPPLIDWWWLFHHWVL